MTLIAALCEADPQEMSDKNEEAEDDANMLIEDKEG